MIFSPLLQETYEIKYRNWHHEPRRGDSDLQFAFVCDVALSSEAKLECSKRYMILSLMRDSTKI